MINYYRDSINEVVNKVIDMDQATKFKDEEEMTKDVREWSPFTSDFKVSFIFKLKRFSILQKKTLYKKGLC